MAESKRDKQTILSGTIPTSSQNMPLAPKSSHSAVQETSSADSGTIRLRLKLFETDERHFPEFSYSQLLEHQGDQQKKTDRIQDLIDIGYGYDEEDSFIDNSEAYDEFVPASITTKFGGFYVNSGVLHFRQGSDPEIELASAEKSPGLKKKPRLMQNDVQNEPPKKLCRPGDEMSNIKPQLSTISDVRHNEVKIRKNKKGKTLSVTSMLKKFGREKEKERLKMESQRAYSLMCGSTVHPFPADAAGCGGLISVDPLLCLIGSTNDHTLIQAANTADFDIDLDSLLDVTEENLGSKSLPQSTAEMKRIQSMPDDQNPMSICSETIIQTSKVNSVIKPEPHQTQLLSDESTTPLSGHLWASMPEGLPPGLQKSIGKLMLAAKTSEGESKLKFFSPNVNSIMLDIELQCREQSGHLRSKVYTHLSSFLPCSRDTLLKRVRKLAISHVEDPDGEEHHIQKLKEAIERSMPEQIQWFQKSCLEYEQVKSSKRADDANMEDRGGKRGGPRKLFKWNGEIRECFGNVLEKKMVKYNKEGNDSQEMEDYIKTLLDEIKPLWPKGWMQSRVLVRESKKLLGFNASLQVGKAKSKKKQVFLKCASSVLDGCNTQKSTTMVTMDHSSETAQDPIISTSFPADVKMREDDIQGLDRGFAISSQSDNLRLKASAVPTLTSSNLCAKQKAVQHLPPSVTQELLAAAVAEYNRSEQLKNLDAETISPSFSPPPPHFSFLVNPAAPSQLLPPVNARHLDSSTVYVISDDDE